LVRPHVLGRWPRLVWTAPLVLKAFMIKLLYFRLILDSGVVKNSA